MRPHWLSSLLARVNNSRGGRRRSAALRVEGLEQRDTPAAVTLAGGVLTYTAAAGVANNITVSVTGGNFVINDAAETIDASGVAGAAGSGTNTVTVPEGTVTSLVFDLGDAANTVTGVTGLTTRNLTVTAADGLTLAGNVTLTTGTVTLAANTDGAGADGLVQTGGVVTTTNNTAAAATVTANTAGGGTGDVAIDSFAVGSAANARLTVNSNGGSILYPGATALTLAQRGLANGGSSTGRNLIARDYVFTAGGSIGTDDRPVQTAAGLSGAPVVLTAGAGGAFLTDWNTPIVLNGATATGAGNIRVVTANVGGHNLTIGGNVSTGSGNIYLAADDNFVVNAGVTIGGAGFSGTVWIQGNRDQGTAGQPVTMNATSAIVTSNATNVATATRTPATQAVYIDVSGDAGTPSSITLGTITTGAGGRVVATAIPNGIAAEAGRIVTAGASNVINVGATGTVELAAGITAATLADAVGTAALPIRVAGGSVIVASNFGNTYVTGDAATAYTVAVTALGTQTTAPTLSLATAAGPLTVAGLVANVNGGAVTLTSTGAGGGVVVNAPLGTAATGNITVNAGTNAATLNSTLTVNATRVLAVTAAGGLVVSATGVVTGTGAAANNPAVAVQSGGLLTPAGAGAAGTLSLGNTALAAGAVLRVDLNSTSAFDVLNVGGTADVTGATLQLFVNNDLNVGDSFTILTNDGAEAVVGQFAGGTTFEAANDPRFTFTINYAGGDGNDVVATVTTEILTSIFDVVGGAGVFTSGTGLANGLTVTRSGGNVTITDAAGPIALTGRAAAANFTGGGTNTITGPESALTSLAFGLEAGADTLNGIDTGALPMSFTGNGTGTLTVAGTVASTAGVTATGYTDLVGTAAGVFQAPAVSLTAANAVGTAATRVNTRAGTITATAGAGGVFLSEADGAAVTAAATGAGSVDVLNLDGTLTVAGPVTTATGNVVLSSDDGVVLAANVNAGSGTVSIAANTDGAGAEGVAQTAGTVTTTNTTAGAATVTVNTAGGGTGDASLDSFVVGAAAGGTLAVTSNGGSVLYAGAAALDDFQRGVVGNGGTAPARLLRAAAYVFTATGAGSVGTDARPIQSDNFAAVNTGTFAAGSGGVYWTDWGATAVFGLAGATATGAGNVRVVTANANGHNLDVTGPVTTGSGSIVLAADDNFTLTAAVGGAGFSGTVYLAGNRDTGNTVNLQMNAGASVVTTNATAGAVVLEGFNLSGTRAGAIVVNTITVGDGGTITLNTTPAAGSQGAVTAFDDAVVLTAGPAGRVVFSTAAQAGATAAVGTPTRPIRVAAGSVLATVADGTGTAGGVYVTGTGPTSFTATTGGAGTVGPIVLVTEAGALTVGGPTNTANGEAVTLTGAGGVVVAAALGGAGTGAIGVTGPLSGAGDITLGTGALTITQDAASSYAGVVGGGQAVTKQGTGTLTLTGASTYTGGTTVAAGGLRADNGTGSATGTGPVAVADGAVLGGGGAITGAVVASGTLDPGAAPAAAGRLAAGGLDFGPAGARAVTIDLAGTAAGTGYDQLAVTGAVDLTDAALNLAVAAGFAPGLGTAFTIVSNDAADPVAGTFTGLAEGGTVVVAGRTYTISYVGGDGNDVVLTVTAVPASTLVNTVPGPQTVAEDGALVFSAANGNAVAVTDPAVGAGLLTVTLTAANGVLTVASTAGLSFTTGDGTADPTMTFAGTLAAVNAALDGLRFDPTANFNGSASVTLTATEQANAFQTDTDTVAVTVTEVNDAPTAGNDTAADVAEDSAAVTITAAALTANDTTGPANESAQTLTVTAVSNVVGGTAVVQSGNVVFTPAANFFGAAGFTYTVTDNGTTNGAADPRTATAAVSFTITPVNDAPTAAADTVADVAEDSGPYTIPAAAVLANDAAGPANESGQALAITAVVVTSGGGTAVVQGGNIVYTPAADAFGPVVLTYTVSDNGSPVESSTATVSFTVTAVNDAPTASPDTLPDVAEDAAPVTISGATLTANDTTGPANESAQTLTVTAVSNVVGGTAVVQSGNVVFTPAANFFGAAGFTYTVTDNGTTNGAADPRTATAAVTFTITPVNDAPTATADTLPNVAEDSPAVTIAGGTLTANDSAGPANETGQALTVTAVSNVVGGTAVVQAGDVVFTPAADFFGTASFTYAVSDGAATATAAATFTITAVNDAPTAAADTAADVAEDAAPVTITAAALTANDTTGPANESGQTLTITAVSNVVGGTAVVQSGNVVFTPAANFFGPAGFTYTVSDNGTTNGAADPRTASAAVTFTITPVNDAPTASPDTVADVAEDSGPYTIPAAAVLANDATGPANESGQALAITAVVVTSGGGTAVVQGGNIVYTPAADAFGPVVLTYTVSDNGTPVESSTATVSFTVTPVNDAPTANPDTLPDVAEDAAPVTITAAALTANDTAGPANESAQTLTITAVSNVVGGTAVVQAGNVVFTPAADFFGPAGFTYTVSDGAATATAAATFTITAVNDAPTANPDTLPDVAEDAAPVTISGATLTANDSAGPANESGQTLAVTAVSNVVGGTAVVQAGDVVFTPAADFFGTASFTYTVSDGAATATAAASFTITPVNDAPVLGQAGGTVTYEVGGPAVALDADATVTDIDSADFDTGTLTVAPAGAEAADRLEVRNDGTGPGQVGVAGGVVSFGGTPVGTVAGGAGSTPLVVTFTAAAAPAAVQAVVRNLTFRNTAASPATTDRTATLTVTDGDGGTSAAATVTIQVVANVAPVVTLPGGPVAYTEGGSAVPLDPAATVADADSADLAGGQLTVSFTAGGTAADELLLLNGGGVTVSGTAVSVSGVEVGAVSGGTGGTPLVVAFDTDATPAAAQAVLRAVAYRNTSDAPAATRTVRVTLSDGDGGTSTPVTETVTVTAVNDAPVNTVGGPLTTAEDTPLDLGAAVTVADADAGTGAVTVTLAVTGGTLTLGGTSNLTVTGDGTASVVLTGTVADVNAGLLGSTFTPAADFTGAAAVQVTTTDNGNTGGTAETDDDTLSITVTAVNDAPVVTVPGPLATPEDTPLAVTGVSVADPDAAGGTVTVSLSVTAGTLTVTDTSGLAAAGGNGTAAVVLTGTAAAVNAALASGLTFAPPADFNGPVTLTVAADDGGNTGAGAAGTDSETVAIAVTAADDAPTFTVPASATTVEDAGAVTVAGFATGISAGPADEAGQTLTFTTAVTATTGSLAFTTAPAVDPATGDLTFTAAADTNGTATVDITLSDGTNTTVRTVTIEVAAVNDAPTFELPGGDPPASAEDAGPQTVGGFAADFQPGPATATDEVGQTPTYLVTVTGTTGGLAFADGPAIDAAGTLTYTAAADTSGTATVTVFVRDGGGTANDGIEDSDTRTFTITVTAVNDAPTAAADTLPAVAEDAAAFTISGAALTANDSAGPADESGQTLTVTAVSNVVGGTAVVQAGDVVFTPAADFNGTASFTYTVSDGAATATATASFTVTAVNDAPTAAADTLPAVAEDAAAFTISGSTLTANDSAGPANESTQTLAVTAVSNVVGGTAVVQAGDVVFTPAADFNGTASFSYTVSDGAATATATASFTVTAVNDAPTAAADALPAVTEDAAAFTISGAALTANDSAGPANESTQTLTITAVSNVVGGTAVVQAGDVVFTPAADFFGTASFTYTVSDGAATATAAATFTVTAVNDAPTAAADTLAAVAEDSPAVTIAGGTLTANDSAGPANESGQALTVTAVSNVVGGTAVVQGGNVVFTPAANFNGTAGFTYTVSDGAGSATAAATFTITAVNDAPTAAADVATVGFNAPATPIDVLANDTTGPDAGESLAVVAVTQGANGTVAAAGGQVTYTPQAGFSGTDSFTYTVGDGNGGTATATVTVTVTGESRRSVDQNEVGMFAAAPGPGSDGRVTVFNPDGTVAYTVTPFAPADAVGGVRVVVADATGDGVPDVIAGTGPGVASQVVVVDGVTRQVVRQLRPFEAGFTGGVFVAAADVDGDGTADVAVSADVGGSSRVTVFGGAAGGVLADFFGIDDPNFRGGSRVAFGDLNGDGTADLAVAAGVGGGPRVAVFDGRTLRPGTTPSRLVNDFFVFESSLRDGAYVALGDLTGDGRAEVIAGGGPTGGPRVFAVDGGALRDAGVFVPRANFFVADTTARSGATLAVKNFDGDALADLVVAARTDAGVVVKTYLGRTIKADGEPPVADDLSDMVTGTGVFVG